MADLDEMLKPCPFGCSAPIGHRTTDHTVVLVCTECGASGPYEEGSPEDEAVWSRAIAAWNRRAYLDATQAQAPDVVEALTDQEIHFCLTVLANPGAKIRDVGDEVLFREAVDGTSVPSWEVAEKLGFVTCVGSYKWIPTEKLRATLRRIFSALSGAEAKPVEYPVSVVGGKLVDRYGDQVKLYPAPVHAATVQGWTLYDWEYTDPKTGKWAYARTPERAQRLIDEGVKLTSVYVPATDTARPLNSGTDPLPTPPAGGSDA